MLKRNICKYENTFANKSTTHASSNLLGNLEVWSSFHAGVIDWTLSFPFLTLFCSNISHFIFCSNISQFIFGWNIYNPLASQPLWKMRCWFFLCCTIHWMREWKSLQQITSKASCRIKNLSSKTCHPEYLEYKTFWHWLYTRNFLKSFIKFLDHAIDDKLNLSLS